MMKKNINQIIFVLITAILCLSGRVIAQETKATKYVCLGLGNLVPDVDFGISIMNKVTPMGCNSVLLTIWWDRVYPKPDSKPDFRQLDNQINHAINTLGIKVAIRIQLGRDFTLTKGFWSEDESVKDFKGYPLTDYYNTNNFSFAHQPSVEKAKGFVKEICERYKKYQKEGKIIFITVVNTPQQELGYGFQNQQWPSPFYPAVFDHSKWAMIKFKDSMREKYTNIRTLNSYWATNYKSFSEVEPYVNWANVKDSFRGRRGQDWYVIRHIMLKNYYDQIIDAIKSVDKNYQVACEYGGIADNLTLLRTTYGFVNLTEKADILKTSVEGFQGDLAASNLLPHQKFYTEVAFFDLQTEEDIKKYVRRAISYNCEFIMLGISEDPVAFNKTLPAFQDAVRSLNETKKPLVFEDSVSYKLSQLIDSREMVLNDWKSRSNEGQKAVKVKLIEDLILENKPISNPLPDEGGNNYTPSGIPPKKDGPNELPVATIKNYTKEVVIGQEFRFRLPEHLFYDRDGFIAYIDVVEMPAWLSFNLFELTFSGKNDFMGKNEIKLRIYDNNGYSIDESIFIDVVPPIVDLELIKADYFDIPIQGWGYLENNRTLVLDALPEKLNIIAHCNLDSALFRFELSGPYKIKRESSRVPYNLFGEGRGLAFPVGNYSLHVKAFKKDSLVTYKTVTFKVIYSTDSLKNILPEWKIYPNPFENICNIKLPENTNHEQLNFYFLSAQGNKLPFAKESIKIDSGIAYIDLEHLPSGNLILQVESSGKILKSLRITKI